MITCRCGVCGSEWFIRGRRVVSQHDVACGRCAHAGKGFGLVVAEASEDPTMMDLFPSVTPPAFIEKLEVADVDMTAAAGRTAMSLVTAFYTMRLPEAGVVQARMIAEVCRQRRCIVRLWGQQIGPAMMPLVRIPSEMKLVGNVADVMLSHGLRESWDGDWQALAERGVVNGKA
jgi:hypothetical protein